MAWRSITPFRREKASKNLARAGGIFWRQHAACRLPDAGVERGGCVTAAENLAARNQRISRICSLCLRHGGIKADGGALGGTHCMRTEAVGGGRGTRSARRRGHNCFYYAAIANAQRLVAECTATRANGGASLRASARLMVARLRAPAIWGGEGRRAIRVAFVQ